MSSGFGRLHKPSRMKTHQTTGALGMIDGIFLNGGVVEILVLRSYHIGSGLQSQSRVCIAVIGHAPVVLYSGFWFRV